MTHVTHIISPGQMGTCGKCVHVLLPTVCIVSPHALDTVTTYSCTRCVCMSHHTRQSRCPSHHSKRQSIYLNDPNKQYAPVNDSCPYDLHNTDLTVKVCRLVGGIHLAFRLYPVAFVGLKRVLSPQHTPQHILNTIPTHPQHSFATL